MRSPVGVGLVGTGGFGVFCLDAFTDMPEIKVVAVADTDLRRAQSAAPSGARAYEGYDGLLADPNVEIIAINTPPFLHGPMAIQAAQAGKHIFVEKPLATSVEEAKAAIQAAQDARVQMTVDYVLRYHPLHTLATHIVQSGALGAMRHWSLENFAADDSLLPDHWFWDPVQSGGIHVEHGVHFFDLCNHLVGAAPDTVSGFVQQRPDGRVDRVSATVCYGNDVLATFYHSFNQIRRIEETTIRINCEHGHIMLFGWIPTRLTLTGLVNAPGLIALEDLLGDHLDIVEQFDDREFKHGDAVEQLAAQVQSTVHAPDRQGDYRRAIQAGMQNLVEVIWGEQTLQVTAEDGLLSLAVGLAATESAACGRTLPVVI